LGSDGQETAGPEIFSEVGPGSNIAFFFDSDHDHREVLTRFMAEGVQRGEKIIYLTRTREPGEIHDYLRRYHCPIRSGQLQVLDPPEFTSSEAIELAAQVTATFEQELARARAEGFHGLRITSDYSMAAGLQEKSRLRFKKAIHDYFAQSGDCILLCQYDLRICDPAILLDMLFTHSQVLYRGACFPNYYYASLEMETESVDDARLNKLMACLENLARRRSAEEKGHKNLTSLAEAQRIAHLGNFEWDLRCDICLYSEETFRILGVPSRGDESGPPLILKMIHPDDKPRVRAVVDESLRTKTPLEVDFRIVRPDGSVREIFSRAQISCQSGGRAVRLVGTIQDVTESRQVEREIKLRARQQAVIAELGQKALAGGHLDALIETSVATVAETLQVDFCQVLEYLPREDLFLMRAGYGWHEQNGDRGTFAIDRSLHEGRALFAGGRPIIIGELAGDASAPALARFLSDHRVVNGASLAISGQGNPFGVLGVYSRKEYHFSQEDLVFLQSVANVLAVALERERADREIQKLAYYDSLTGLPNRTLLSDRLAQAVSRAGRDSKEVAVMFLDLDRFKTINDTLGHTVGDQLLRIVADRLQGCLRRSDTVARIGGDEFVVILSSLDQEEDIPQVAQKILHELAQGVMLEEHEIFTSASIGIAVFPVDGEETGTLLRHADIAMYQAKERGKNTYQFFSHEMNRKAIDRLMLENSLRKGLKRDQFFLLYQPQLDLRSGRMVGVEALVRWNHPQLGVLSPDRFIPVAEESGLILNLGAWVLRTACAQAQQWRREGYPPLRIAVNLSSRQFSHPAFIDMLDHILEETGFDPASLELELTESIIMEEPEFAIMTLTDIKVRGISLAIDDFGTGYSSLSYLKHFPFDRLKVAQSFVHDVTSDTDNAAIVDAVIAVAQSLNIKVIAEGVETRKQLDFLYARQCDEVQGFYFGRPIPAEKLVELLREGFVLKEVCPFDPSDE